MTEKQTDSAASVEPSPPLSMLLMRAGRIASFDAAKGWPDALTFGELAALQYPEEGSASGNGLGPSYKSLKQLDFFDCLNNFVKRGDVQAVKVDRPMPIQSLDAGPLEMWPCDAIDRPAAVAFLNAIHEEPGELVWEWLGMEWHPTQTPESAGSERPRKTANRQTGRRDRLRVAMESGLQAYRDRHKAEPTSGDLFDWMGEHDGTGVITEYTDEYLWWKPSEGPEKKIDRKAFAKRMTAIWANSPR